MRVTLAELLDRQVKDPRVEGVTVTGVQVTSDMAHAKVWFSVLGGEEEKRVALRGLQNVSGFLRREIGRRLRIRAAPELQFFFDASLEHGERIETLLREWHEESARGGEAAPESAAEERPERRAPEPGSQGDS
jgi:ribosome-binding factor A